LTWLGDVNVCTTFTNFPLHDSTSLWLTFCTIVNKPSY
jgi:hypothetical protein